MNIDEIGPLKEWLFYLQAQGSHVDVEHQKFQLRLVGWMFYLGVFVGHFVDIQP